MSDLVEFLLARIAEDEERAHAAGGAYARRSDTPSEGETFAIVSGPGEIVVEVDMEAELRAHPDTLAVVSHLADWLPGRVLAECEAKRRIVEDYQALEADYRVTRSEVTEARRFQAIVSVGQLAAVYDDHPDYDEAWRP